MSSWREERTFPEISLECEGCLLEPLLKSRIFWPRFCHLGMKLLLPGLCVYLLWCLSCAAQHSAVTKENPSSGSICQQGCIKGRVCWLRVGWFPCPLENLGRVSASEGKEEPITDSLEQFVEKVLLNSKSSADDTGLCWCFPACDSPRTSKGKYLLSPVMGAVSFQHASQGWSQTGRIFFEINPGLAITHRLLRCCPWQCASLRCWLTRDLSFLHLWVACDVFFRDCQEGWLDPVFVFSL